MLIPIWAQCYLETMGSQRKMMQIFLYDLGEHIANLFPRIDFFKGISHLDWLLTNSYLDRLHWLVL